MIAIMDLSFLRSADFHIRPQLLHVSIMIAHNYVLEPCAGIASVSKRPSEEPLKEYHIAFSVVLLDSKYSIMTPKFVKQKSHYPVNRVSFDLPR